ncbi:MULTISPECIES: hypothetical protein [Haloarcula]|uniref:hypothetical protein n=1 Tax=Haloarcula TaxID=2237 RepID=UPI0023EDABC9|nr:hypothetical protein [Halomicroarcula sp. XH51]
MKRRALLALCGSLFATPGCVSLTGGSLDGTDTLTPAPPPDIDTDDGTGTRTDVGTVTVESAAVQQGVVGPDSPDSIGVFDDAERYLVVSAGVDGPAPEREAFALRVGDDVVRPATFTNGLYRDGNWRVRYGSAGGPLVFPLSAVGADDAVGLEWPGGSWTPPDRVRERLTARLPGFAVSLDGPTEVGPDDDPEITVSVTNVGDGGGRYVLAMNRSGPRVAFAPVRRLAGELGPGESVRRTFDAKSPYDADAPTVTTYLLDAPGDRQDATLRMEPAGEPTGTATRRDRAHVTPP